MNKKDWISYIISFFIIALIQLLMGTFNLTTFLVVSIIALAVIKLVSIFKN